jgi:hypothetical protein
MDSTRTSVATALPRVGVCASLLPGTILLLTGILGLPSGAHSG